MVTRYVMFVALLAVLAGCSGSQTPRLRAEATSPTGATMILPPVKGTLATKYPMSVTEALAARRSVRSFESSPLTTDQLSLLCWAAQGVTEPKSGKRTAPSAVAVYPMTVYVVTQDGLDEYVPHGHALKRLALEDMRQKLFEVARQESMRQSPAVFVIALDVEKLRAKTGDRAELMGYVEAGHIAQNILLEATSMNLAGVPAAGFDTQKTTTALGLPASQKVIYIVPVGQAKAAK